MTTWIVDDGPFGELAYVFEDAWKWPAATLHVMESVSRAAATDKSGRRKKLLELRDASGKPAVVTHSITIDSPAGKMVYGHLRPDASSSAEDLGEHEAIAFCAKSDVTATFVAMDKLACFLALCELGPGRVASPFDLWLDLKNQGLIKNEVFDKLVAKTAKVTGLSRPLRLG